MENRSSVDGAEVAGAGTTPRGVGRREGSRGSGGAGRLREAPRSGAPGRGELRPRVSRLLPALLLCAVQASAPGGQAAADETPAWDVRERLRADLLVILAHPDDEGVVAPLVAREALEAGRRAGVIYLTDGRNGTNRAGSLAGRSFGIARLAEAAWTLRRLGVRFHRCLERADGLGRGDPAVVLRGWDREATVAELARLVRLFRPVEIITWFPGPASSSPDHAAAGGAALLAAARAADPGAFPDQIAIEGLAPHATSEVWLVAQAEKLGYEIYPGTPGPAATAPDGTRIIDLDVPSPALGLRYTDIAREALREQRSVAAASNLGRNGAFDEPLRLLPARLGASASPPPPSPAADGAAADSPALRIAEGRSAMQVFLEVLAAEIESPGIVGAFLPEATVPAGAPVPLVLRATWAAGMKGKVSLDLPRGWTSTPSRHEVAAEPGEAVDLAWEVRAPAGAPPGHAAAHLVARPSDRARGGGRASFVLTVPRP